MANTATLTGKSAGGAQVTGLVLNNIRGYEVDMQKGELTVITETGATVGIDLTGTVTLTTSINMSTKVNSVTCSVS